MRLEAPTATHQRPTALSALHGGTPFRPLHRPGVESERIKTWQPWAQSTGPRTAEGKATASRNGRKGGHREMQRELARVLREQHQAIEA